MKRTFIGTVVLLVSVFVAGFFSHLLYQRWTVPFPEGQGYPVTFLPLQPPATRQAEIPLVQAREVEKIRGLAGNQARVRGRVYRVGHSVKSNTHFINFGPSRSSFTGVIFASAFEMFEKKKLHPRSYEGREVEIIGEIKDHPKYGLEIIVEDPSQIKVID